MTTDLSIIVPVLNEASGIEEALQRLRTRLTDQGITCQLIVVDGGSQDETVNLARPLCDHVIVSAPGRANQMNAGAALARGDVLLFLHIDTHLPNDFVEQFRLFVRSGLHWGFSPVRLTGDDWRFRVIERMISWRSRLTGGAGGDQAQMILRSTFEAIGGYPSIALMEDLALARECKQRGLKPFHFLSPVLTSSRRWEQYGVFRTIWLMWSLRAAFYRGVDPQSLAERYR